MKIQKHNLGKTLGKVGEVVLKNYARQKGLNQASITSDRQGSRTAKTSPLFMIFKLFQL